MITFLVPQHVFPGKARKEGRFRRYANFFQQESNLPAVLDGNGTEEDLRRKAMIKEPGASYFPVDQTDSFKTRLRKGNLLA